MNWTIDPDEPKDHPDDTYSPTQYVYRVLLDALRDDHSYLTKFRDSDPLKSAAIRKAHGQLLAESGFGDVPLTV